MNGNGVRYLFGHSKAAYIYDRCLEKACLTPFPQGRLASQACADSASRLGIQPAAPPHCSAERLRLSDSAASYTTRLPPRAGAAFTRRKHHNVSEASAGKAKPFRKARGEAPNEPLPTATVASMPTKPVGTYAPPARLHLRRHGARHPGHLPLHAGRELHL